MSEKESKKGLSERPLLSIIILLVLYVAFLAFPLLIWFLLFGPSISGLMLYFIIGINFAIITVLWLFIVPNGLHLPNGRESFLQYLNTIKLSHLTPIGKNILLGILCTAVFFASMLISTLLTGLYVFNLTLILPPTSDSLLSSFKPGIWEEVAFRGVILFILLKKFPVRKAILIDAVLFGVFHLTNLIFNPTLIGLILTLRQVGFTTILGLFFAYLTVKTDSLLPAIITHYLFDAIGLLFYNAPSIDPFVHLTVLLFTGYTLIPTVINVFMVNYISKKWYPNKIDI